MLAVVDFRGSVEFMLAANVLELLSTLLDWFQVLPIYITVTIASVISLMEFRYIL